MEIYEGLIAEPRERLGEHLSKVVSHHSEVMGGEVMFAGTEVPIRDLIEHLKSGDPLNDFTSHQQTAVTRDQTVAYLEATLELAGLLMKIRETA